MSQKKDIFSFMLFLKGEKSMEEKENITNSSGTATLYTKEQVLDMMKKRVQRTHNAFFSRYGVKDLMELDEIVDFGYKYKRQQESENRETATKHEPEFSFDELIGLDSIKKKINRLAALVLKNKCLKVKQSMNYVFLGNPGTGKTVAARALTQVFFDKGILKHNKLVEADRTMLIGEYIGQTAPRVKKTFEEALGGVLFIDEAYSLAVDPHSSNDYCHEALMVLNKMMEDYRGQLVVILAGYKDETLRMLEGNRGLKSRINSYFNFNDYKENEMKQILNILANKYKYTIEEETKAKMIRIAMSKRNKKEYSNARELRNILEGVMEFQAERTDDYPWDRTIKLEDLLNWQIENEVVLDTDLIDA